MRKVWWALLIANFLGFLGNVFVIIFLSTTWVTPLNVLSALFSVWFGMRCCIKNLWSDNARTLMES